MGLARSLHSLTQHRPWRGAWPPALEPGPGPGPNVPFWLNLEDTLGLGSGKDEPQQTDYTRLEGGVGGMGWVVFMRHVHQCQSACQQIVDVWAIFGLAAGQHWQKGVGSRYICDVHSRPEAASEPISSCCHHHRLLGVSAFCFPRFAYTSHFSSSLIPV